MKILIIGGSSFIGKYILSALKISISKQIIGTYFQHKTQDTTHQLNIQDSQKLKYLILNFLPDIIFWIAGNKNLKMTEESLEFSRQINTYPVMDLIDIIKKNLSYNPRIIFFSTDYIFDGNRGLYTSNDFPSPLTNYGISNHEAEIEFIKNYDNYLILRTSAVMGKGGAFFDFLLQALEGGGDLKLFDNIFFSPTPIYAIIESIPILLTYKTPTILHLSADISISRYEFGKQIQKALINKNLYVSTTTIIPSKAQGYFLPNLSLKCSDCFFNIIKKYQKDWTLWIK